MVSLNLLGTCLLFMTAPVPTSNSYTPVVSNLISFPWNTSIAEKMTLARGGIEGGDRREGNDGIGLDTAPVKDVPPDTPSRYYPPSPVGCRDLGDLLGQPGNL
jgi:hypothetical protein